MTGPVLYSFDTSAFINGRRDLFPPEIFRTLWTNIEVAIASGVIRSTDDVREELGKRDDATKAWASAQSDLFVQLEQDVQMATSTVLRRHPKLLGVGKGRNGADPFVIGLAHARALVVVTEEHRTGRIDKPKIPDVCEAMGVRCVNLVGFIRDQGWTF